VSLCIFFRWSSESKTKSHALSVRVIGKAVDVNRDYEERKGSGGSWGTVDTHFLTFLTLAKYPHLTEPTSSTLLRAGLEVSVAVQSRM